MQLANTAERYYCRESVTSDCERPAYIDYHFYRPPVWVGHLNYTHTHRCLQTACLFFFFVHNTSQCVKRGTTTWTGFQRCATQLQCGNGLGWSWMIEAKPQMCRGRKIEFACTNEKFLKLLLSYAVCPVLRYINFPSITEIPFKSVQVTLFVFNFFTWNRPCRWLGIGWYVTLTVW